MNLTILVHLEIHRWLKTTDHYNAHQLRTHAELSSGVILDRIRIQLFAVPEESNPLKFVSNQWLLVAEAPLSHVGITMLLLCNAFNLIIKDEWEIRITF